MCLYIASLPIVVAIMITVEKIFTPPPLPAIVPNIQVRTKENLEDLLTPSSSNLTDKITAELNATHSWDKDDQIALEDWDEQFEIERH
jgi:hypothetical protein